MYILQTLQERRYDCHYTISSEAILSANTDRTLLSRMYLHCKYTLTNLVVATCANVHLHGAPCMFPCWVADKIRGSFYTFPYASMLWGSVPEAHKSTTPMKE